MVMVDANVLLDVITADPIWCTWSTEALQRHLDAGPASINAIVYAEIAFVVERIEDVDNLLPSHLYRYLSIPREASFLAARAHAAYRERGGQRQMILPDFLIGAHALVAGIPLLTRDQRRYRQAFPGLTLISPDPDPTAAR
jgi:predicted nucleic acid-binding protein